MCPGYQATQALHAAVELSMEWPHKFKEWNGTVVSLGVPNENELLEWLDWCDGYCYHTIFYEPDITAHTSIACLLDEKQAKAVAHLPLLLQGGGEQHGV